MPGMFPYGSQRDYRKQPPSYAIDDSIASMLATAMKPGQAFQGTLPAEDYGNAGLDVASLIMGGSSPASTAERALGEGMVVGVGPRVPKAAPRSVFPEMAKDYPPAAEPVRKFDNPKKPEGYLTKG